MRRLRIFTGAMRASTPNVSCTLQYVAGCDMRFLNPGPEVLKDLPSYQ